ncbi:hypothetical protein TSAR_011563 [Trichomalopsis sarcophagae]|uniref:Uncharacterized protein n=1 Tax=Trichomalopsis sarcophagae TaxID=543379 RepID=A0A232ETC8_9HYME|nr:hypothetical protein TSAR_011563 [Trichomalopsis sarcophagae]
MFPLERAVIERQMEPKVDAPATALLLDLDVRHVSINVDPSQTSFSLQLHEAQYQKASKQEIEGLERNGIPYRLLNVINSSERGFAFRYFIDFRKLSKALFYAGLCVTDRESSPGGRKEKEISYTQSSVLRCGIPALGKRSVCGQTRYKANNFKDIAVWDKTTLSCRRELTLYSLNRSENSGPLKQRRFPEDYRRDSKQCARSFIPIAIHTQSCASANTSRHSTLWPGSHSLSALKVTFKIRGVNSLLGRGSLGMIIKPLLTVLA